MNIRTAQLGTGGATLGGMAVPLPGPRRSRPARGAGLGELFVGVRPEESSIVAAETAAALSVEVTLVEELGADAYVYGRLASDSDNEKPWVLRCESRVAPRIGDQIRITVDGASVHGFDPGTGLLLV